MLQEAVCHLLCILITFLCQRSICFVRISLQRDAGLNLPIVSLKLFEKMLSDHTAYPNKICVPRLNVKIQEIEDDTVRKITETAIVDNQSFPCINHLTFKWALPNIYRRKITGFRAYLYVIEILFLHGLELRYSGRDSAQVVLDSIIQIPTHILTNTFNESGTLLGKAKDSRQVKISWLCARSPRWFADHHTSTRGIESPRIGQLKNIVVRQINRVPYLDVLFRKLLCKRPPPSGDWINGIIYCNLPVFMI